MRNTALAIALASVGLFALPNVSHADSSNGFFINGNIGQTTLDKGAYDDNDTGYAANIGYRWAVAPNALIGIEGGYTRLGSFSPKAPYGGIGDASVKGWNLGANGHFNLTDNWYVSARGGLFRADVNGSYINSTEIGPDGVPVYGVTRVSDTSTKWYAGAGFGYDFNSNFSLGLNYDYYKADKNGLNFDPYLISVSGEYRF